MAISSREQARSRDRVTHNPSHSQSQEELARRSRELRQRLHRSLLPGQGAPPASGSASHQRGGPPQDELFRRSEELRNRLRQSALYHPPPSAQGGDRERSRSREASSWRQAPGMRPAVVLRPARGKATSRSPSTSPEDDGRRRSRKTHPSAGHGYRSLARSSPGERPDLGSPRAHSSSRPAPLTIHQLTAMARTGKEPGRTREPTPMLAEPVVVSEAGRVSVPRGQDLAAGSVDSSLSAYESSSEAQDASSDGEFGVNSRHRDGGAADTASASASAAAILGPGSTGPAVEPAAAPGFSPAALGAGVPAEHGSKPGLVLKSPAVTAPVENDLRSHRRDDESWSRSSAGEEEEEGSRVSTSDSEAASSEHRDGMVTGEPQAHPLVHGDLDAELELGADGYLGDAGPGATLLEEAAEGMHEPGEAASASSSSSSSSAPAAPAVRPEGPAARTGPAGPAAVAPDPQKAATSNAAALAKTAVSIAASTPGVQPQPGESPSKPAVPEPPASAASAVGAQGLASRRKALPANQLLRGWASLLQRTQRHPQYSMEYTRCFNVEGKGWPRAKAGTSNRVALGLDCEMIFVKGNSSALARVSVVTVKGTLLDAYVHWPRESILDYRTQISGVEAHHLLVENGALPFETVQERVLRLLAPETILVGHSLHNDLKALRMVHTKIVDTALIFTVPGEHTWKKHKLHSLVSIMRDRAATLKSTVDSKGHDSRKDAEWALQLALYEASIFPRYTGPQKLETFPTKVFLSEIPHGAGQSELQSLFAGGEISDIIYQLATEGGEWTGTATVVFPTSSKRDTAVAALGRYVCVNVGPLHDWSRRADLKRMQSELTEHFKRFGQVRGCKVFRPRMMPGQISYPVAQVDCHPATARALVTSKEAQSFKKHLTPFKIQLPAEHPGRHRCVVPFGNSHFVTKVI